MSATWVPADERQRIMQVAGTSWGRDIPAVEEGVPPCGGSGVASQLDVMSDSTGSPLSSLAGPFALLGGGFFAAAGIGLFFALNPSDLVAMLAAPTFRVFSIAYAVTFWGLMIALIALHARQAHQSGTFGVIGLCAATIGTMALGADMWFEAFAVPWIVTFAPQLLIVEKAPLWQAGYLSSFALFAIGWALFGVACLRARVLPIAVSAAIVVGGLVGVFAGNPPFGAPLGLAVAAAGWWLIRSARRVDSPVGAPR